jgi:hypothetical protein
MRSCWRFCLVALFSLLACGSVAAYELAMKNGTVVQFQKYRVENGMVICKDEAGREVSFALSDVDMERTKALNAAATPPLELSGAGPAVPGSADESQSLGDAARALRQEGKAHATGQKRSYTDDDMAHTASGELPTLKPEEKQEGAAGAQDGNSSSSSAGKSTTRTRTLTDQEVSEYYDLGREDTARAMLRGANLPSDTPFPGREDWESRLYDAKQDMVHAYFYQHAHVQDDDAYNAWVDKWNAFADIANEGIKKASAYLKDHPQS